MTHGFQRVNIIHFQSVFEPQWIIHSVCTTQAQDPTHFPTMLHLTHYSIFLCSECLFILFCIFRRFGRNAGWATVCVAGYVGQAAAGGRQLLPCPLRFVSSTTTTSWQRIGNPIDDIEEQERSGKTLARHLVDTARSPLTRLNVNCYSVLLSRSTGTAATIQPLHHTVAVLQGGPKNRTIFEC